MPRKKSASKKVEAHKTRKRKKLARCNGLSLVLQNSLIKASDHRESFARNYERLNFLLDDNDRKMCAELCTKSKNRNGRKIPLALICKINQCGVYKYSVCIRRHLLAKKRQTNICRHIAATSIFESI